MSQVPLQSLLPKLPLCVVVESRLHPRREIVHDLEQIGLFSLVSESRSLEHGREQLLNQNADSCVLGPSLNASLVEEFVSECKSDSKSSKCGFLALVESSSSAETCTSADAVVRKPYDVEDLLDAVVRAVVSANPKGAFSKTYLREYCSEQEEVSQGPERAGGSVSLEGIVKGQQTGQFGLQSNGSLSLSTKRALDKVVEQLLAHKSLPEEQFEKAQSSLQDALSDWFTEMVLGSKVEASKLLRERLKQLL